MWTVARNLIQKYVDILKFLIVCLIENDIFRFWGIFHKKIPSSSTLLVLWVSLYPVFSPIRAWCFVKWRSNIKQKNRKHTLAKPNLRLFMMSRTFLWISVCNKQLYVAAGCQYALELMLKDTIEWISTKTMNQPRICFWFSFILLRCQFCHCMFCRCVHFDGCEQTYKCIEQIKTNHSAFTLQNPQFSGIRFNFIVFQ